LNCVHHLQAPPATDFTLHIQERNTPPNHQAIFEISTVAGKTPFSLRRAQKLFLAALAGEDKAALSRCPRKAIAVQ
jgi:hypothetical protein